MTTLRIKKTPVMKKAVGVLKKLSSDERARLLYESREKARRDELARLHGALAEGEAIGLAKGEVIGLAKGEAKLAEAKKQMIKQMLADGMSPDIISRYTGLTVEEIEALR